MKIKIKKLTPEHIDDYICFFDTEDHSDNADEHKCYCVCWCSDDHRTGVDKMSTVEKRRALAKVYVTNGMITGYLAYLDDRVVGWCNTNTKSDCCNCVSYLRLMKDNPITSEDKKTKSIFCFAIAPNMRRKGIATKLLKYVCNEAQKEGYEFVEAYPNKQMKEIDDFEGPLRMYEKHGFYVHEELEDKLVMRKKLV